MTDGFPSLPDALERAAEMGHDPNQSLRKFLGRLTGKSGVELDRLIEDGVRFSHEHPDLTREDRRAAAS